MLQKTWHICLLFSVCVAGSSLAQEATDSRLDLNRAVTESTMQGGLMVVLGCDDPRAVVRLEPNPRFLIHVLDRDRTTVVEARHTLLTTGRYGQISVASYNGTNLPYADHLVSLLVVCSRQSVPLAEMLRVLAPGGVAMVKRSDGELINRLKQAELAAVPSGDSWAAFTKPWPKTLDQWSHFLHGPDNNAVCHDRQVGIPRSIQWVAEPRWARTHEGMASISTAVTADGRLYYIVDEAPLASIRFAGDWKLVARSAFNGKLLWKKRLHSWVDPIRHFRSGPAHLPRRMVATSNRLYVTLGLADPVVALDGATGEVLQTYEGTEYTEEILFDNGTLYLVAGSSEIDRRGEGLSTRGEPRPARFRRIIALAADTGELRWQKDCTQEYVLPLTLAVKSGRVFYQSTRGITCLDAQDGATIWHTPRATPSRRMAFSAPTLVATDSVILSADIDPQANQVDPASGSVQWGVHGWNQPGFRRKSRCMLRAYSAKDGKPLWSAPCQEGYNSPVDLFVIGDVVWVGDRYSAHDLRTGKVVRQMNMQAPRVGMTHHRCYRNKASDRLLFMGKSGVEVFSWDEGRWLSNNSWLRGTCQYGILPANGLLYVPPDACACFLTVKTPGFFAAAPQRSAGGGLEVPRTAVVERGPAADELPTDSTATSTDWPMFRHDVARSGTSNTALPEEPAILWKTRLTGRLTQPIIVGGTVYVASVDSHTVYALARENGNIRWHFTAGGRIDSSPTFYQGRVYFGSADGWIYCLNAETGKLVWRFQAAPKSQLVVSYEQLESAWPVHGAVLIQNGRLYATAGRSTYLDGGIVVYCLDPATGKRLSYEVLSHLDPQTGKQLVPEASFNMEGTTNDVLSGDGERIFLKYFAFDRDGHRTEGDVPHLFSITGFLGEEWFVRSYWICGQGMPGAGWGKWAQAANRFPSGRILCVDGDRVYGYGRTRVAGGPVGHQADTYHLFASSKSPAKKIEQTVTRRGKKTKRTRYERPQPIWSVESELIVRAMVAGRQRLAIAGPRDMGRKMKGLLAFMNPDEALAAFRGERGAYLRLVDKTSGETVGEIELPALPVFDGMATANGQVLVSLKDGSVVCVGSP